MIKLESIINTMYFINLDHRPDRKNHFLEQIKKSKYCAKSTSRYRAVDGKNIDIDSIPSHIITNYGKKQVLSNKVNTLGYDLTAGGLGCALSHFNLYKECIDKNYNSILIFEDDINIDTNFDTILEQVCNLDFNTFDLLYLGYHHDPNTSSHPSGLRKVVNNIYGTFGYIITNRGANFLVNKIFPLSIQIDSAILDAIKKNQITSLISTQKVIHSNSKFSTDIQGQKGLRNKLNDPFLEVFKKTPSWQDNT